MDGGNTYQTPVLFFNGHDYTSGQIDFCESEFRRMALPSWQGPLPKSIRLHITVHPEGVWEWTGFGMRNIRIVKPSLRFSTLEYSTDRWLQDHCGFVPRTRFNLSMEIVEQ